MKKAIITSNTSKPMFNGQSVEFGSGFEVLNSKVKGDTLEVLAKERSSNRFIVRRITVGRINDNWAIVAMSDEIETPEGAETHMKDAGPFTSQLNWSKKGAKDGPFKKFQFS